MQSTPDICYSASQWRAPQDGMSLVELLLAMALSSLLTLMLVQIATAAKSSFRLQESLAELQENTRFFADLLVENISDSGYHPRPWMHDPIPIGLMPASRDASSLNSDRIVSRAWSDRNCLGTLNPVTNVAGEHTFHLREVALELSNGSLAYTCRYGPAADAMTTQVNNQGVIPQVEAFQALYARDADGDGSIDGWVRAGDWMDVSQVLAVRLAILSSSRESVLIPETRIFPVLDFNFPAPADGRMRRVSSYTLPLQPVHL